MPSFFSKSYWFPTEEEVRSRLALYEDEIHVSRINEMDIEAGLQNLPPDDQEGFREMLDLCMYTENEAVGLYLYACYFVD
jgi:hypothetical protein